MAPLLAQLGQSAGSALPRMLVGIGLMVGALVVLTVVLLALRRRLLAPQREHAETMFEHLRRMRDEGRITPEEYDAVRRRMASRIAGRDAPAPDAEDR